MASDSPAPLDPDSITVEYNGNQIVILPSSKSAELIDIMPRVFKFKYFVSKLKSRTCASVCRDGKVTGTETCDDGDAQNGDGCSSTCSVECGFDCSSAPSVCSSSCGDGKQASDELCDDGNTVNGDGCSRTCSKEYGWKCTTLACGKTTCVSKCGDGIVVGTETCDDGNTVHLDGCSSDCTVECGFVCNSMPLSSCSSPCGDGALGGSEKCDDGNTVDGDGCDSACNIERGYACIHYKPPYHPCGAYPSRCTPAPSQPMYTVKMVLKLGMTLASFTSDKQIEFREAIAAAADVQTSYVTIDKISETVGSRRAGESIRVETSINVADLNAADTLKATLTPGKINAELQKVGLPSATILSEGQSEAKVPCSRGFTGPDGQCVKCVAGKYKDSAGSAYCTDCDENILH